MKREFNVLELTWEEQGNYAFPYISVHLHVHGFEPQQAWVDGREVNYQGQYLECKRFQKVHFQGDFAEVKA